jgi:pyocin large subunit-like protein
MQVNTAPDSSPPPLTTVQQSVVNALAARSTVTAAAEAYGIQRMTVYRWMKTRQEFSAALQRARAEFVLARRPAAYRHVRLAASPGAQDRLVHA